LEAVNIPIMTVSAAAFANDIIIPHIFVIP
jgi:hypothetical protein